MDEVMVERRENNKLGPVLPSFQHASCLAPALAAATQDCRVTALWGEEGRRPVVGVRLTTDHLTYNSLPPGPQPYYATYLAVRQTAHDHCMFS